ncbi:MAG TPA: EamA family transporter, partial [Actinomycetota bacterium]|nr:EamA family transporter [Actinomycetota bacterium]
TSTDLQKLRAGIRHRPPGLPWALVSAVGFGIGGFLLAYLSRHLGWVVGLWASRCAQLVGFLVVGLAQRKDLRGRLPSRSGVAAAIGVGLADLLGVVALSIGAHAGFVTIVLVASAVFPLIAVALSIGFLGERPVANQYVGVGLTVLGLLVLGLGGS